MKNTNTRRLKNTILNNQEITEEIKGEIKKYLITNYQKELRKQSHLQLHQNNIIPWNKFTQGGEKCVF